MKHKKGKGILGDIYRGVVNNLPFTNGEKLKNNETHILQLNPSFSLKSGLNLFSRPNYAGPGTELVSRLGKK